jgi:hypothetical protein
MWTLSPPTTLVDELDAIGTSSSGRRSLLVDSGAGRHVFKVGDFDAKTYQQNARPLVCIRGKEIMQYGGQKPQIMMESGRNGSNLDKILENIQRYLGSSNRAPAPAGDASKKIIIRDLVISHAVLNYGLLGSTTVQLPLPELHLTNIGERGQGVSIAEACAKIITEISSSAAHSALRSGVIKDVAVKLEDRLKSKADNVKTLFKGLKK